MRTLLTNTCMAPINNTKKRGTRRGQNTPPFWRICVCVVCGHCVMIGMQVPDVFIFLYFCVLISIKVVSIHSGLTTACNCGVIKLNSPHPARMANGQSLLHGCHINHYNVDVSHHFKKKKCRRGVDSEWANRVPFSELEQVPATNLVPRRRSDWTGLSAITREERGCSMLPRVSHNTTEAPGI